VHSAVFLIYFISAAGILLVSLALMVQFSLPYNKAGIASALCSFILVFFKVYCDLNILLVMPTIFK
jgi:hypothetical protein